MAEYVIAGVALPQLNDAQLKSCKKIVDIKESDGKFYAIIYASWGYQGKKFRNRLEQKAATDFRLFSLKCLAFSNVKFDYHLHLIANKYFHNHPYNDDAVPI